MISKQTQKSVLKLTIVASLLIVSPLFAYAGCPSLNDDIEAQAEDIMIAMNHPEEWRKLCIFIDSGILVWRSKDFERWQADGDLWKKLPIAKKKELVEVLSSIRQLASMGRSIIVFENNEYKKAAEKGSIGGPKIYK